MTSADTTQPTGSAGTSAADAGDVAIQWFHGTACAARVVLGGTRLRIGRAADCHLRLEHASVSRQHAEVYRQGPIHALRDLGSRNGTYLNGQRVEHGVLSLGDVIRAGELVGVVVVDARSAEVVPFGEVLPGLFGGSKLKAALSLAESAARTDLPVLIVGPTGSGKERVARALHHLSGRPGRFHALNCSALPASVAEAELFGHERGAFTGADRARPGHFRAAHGGTLLLDEIADLPLAIQVKLLRVLQEREVMPLGSSDPVPVDVRVLVAAQEPLDHLVEQKRLRADLFARLAGFRLDLDGLSDRREDIPGLFAHFLGQHAQSAPAVEAKLIELLCLHEWPGNVRELELCARKIAALYPGESVLKREHALEVMPALRESPPSAAAGHFSTRQAHDRSRLSEALARLDGNMTAAAASIGISRRRAYRLLAQGRSPDDRDDAHGNPE